jgi:hypothetical protein
MDPVPFPNNRPTLTTTIPEERTLLFRGHAAAFHVTRDMATRGGIRVCRYFCLDPPPRPPRVCLFVLARVFHGSRDRASRRLATSMFLLLCRFFGDAKELGMLF